MLEGVVMPVAWAYDGLSNTPEGREVENLGAHRLDLLAYTWSVEVEILVHLAQDNVMYLVGIFLGFIHFTYSSS
jgi:hypothetical protein